MKEWRETRVLFMPWAGLVAGIVGVAIAHQFGSEATFNNCDANSPVPLLIVAVLCLVLIAVGALESWRVLKEDSETSARRLVAIISLGCVALFIMAILLPMIAALVLPPCFQ